MVVDFDYVKINMIINFVRDYLTLKEVSNVGVIYVKGETRLDINCMNGMAGVEYSIDLVDILEENDPSVITKILLAHLKTLGEG